MKLKDKVAIVTGAGSGMGRAISLLFAKEGARVVVSDISAERAEKVVAEIQAEGGSAAANICNVAVSEDVDKMVNEAVSVFGTVDILVNNAGIMDNFTPVEAITDDLWNQVLAVNTTGPMHTMRKVMPLFLEKKSGNIINIASVGGLFGARAGFAYTASKHALVGMTKNVAFVYANSGVRVNGIAPGGVNTNIGETMREPHEFGMKRSMEGAEINPRSAEPEEIASVALFLASEDASFVNGHILTADSGWTAY